jgi:hypothetical protein
VSETPAATQRTRPSRAWYAAAFVPFVLSLIPAYMLGQAAADEVAVRLEVLTDQAVDLDSDDRSIYAESEELSEQARCTLRTATGEPVDIDDEVAPLATDHGDEAWWRVATLPSDLEDGTYALRCRTGGELLEPSSFAVSSSPSWGRFALLMIAAFAIPVAAAVLGTLIFVVVLAMRRRADRPGDAPSRLPIQLDE